MPQYLVAIYHPDNFDPAQESEATRSEISALNVEMVAAGVRKYVGGLHPAAMAHALRPQPDGEVAVTPGPYLPTSEHIGGLWVLECADLAEALEWGRKASLACRTPVEVRPFH